MTIQQRPVPVRAGRSAWVEYIQYTHARKELPEGTKVAVIRVERGEATVRDPADREHTLPHFNLTAGDEYRGKAGWLPESDPTVRAWFRTEIARLEKQSGSNLPEDVRLGRIESYRRALARHPD